MTMRRSRLNHPPDERAYGTERIPTPGQNRIDQIMFQRLRLGLVPEKVLRKEDSKKNREKKWKEIEFQRKMKNWT